MHSLAEVAVGERAASKTETFTELEGHVEDALALANDALLGGLRVVWFCPAERTRINGADLCRAPAYPSCRTSVKRYVRLSGSF